jgi:hypothetical protein
MGSYIFENYGSAALKHGGVIVGPGQQHAFSSICELLAFISGSNALIFEASPGEVINRLREAGIKAGCPTDIKGVVVGAGETDGLPLPPGVTDSAARQGVQPRTADAHVEIVQEERSDGQQPTEQLHDPHTPLSEGEVFDRALEDGESRETAANTAERARRGQPPVGKENRSHGTDTVLDRPAGGDPVDLFDGSFTLAGVDFDIPTPFMPLRFERVYRSGKPAWGALGFNWDHN